MKFEIEKDHRKKIYKYNFYSLTDLHDYLKTNPKINKSVFYEPSSLRPQNNFNGESLNTAINYCLGGYDNDFERFKVLTNQVRQAGYEDYDSRKLVRSIYGGVALSPLVASGIPDCMISYRQDSEVKYVTIYFQLGYPCITTHNQIFNRGIATLNLIQALQDKGYIVDFKAFELSRCGNEYVDITVNLKRTSELLNISKCYYPLVGREFLRRLLFRVLESTPVKENWSFGYGSPLNTDDISKFYNLKPKDLIISYPGEMEILGNDVYNDTANLFQSLHLENEFNVEKIRQKRL